MKEYNNIEAIQKMPQVEIAKIYCENLVYSVICHTSPTADPPVQQQQ